MLRFPFLDAVLTKMADACPIRLTDGICRVSLGNGNQSNLFRRAAYATGSCSNALLDILEIFTDRRLCNQVVPG